MAILSAILVMGFISNLKRGCLKMIVSDHERWPPLILTLTKMKNTLGGIANTGWLLVVILYFMERRNEEKTSINQQGKTVEPSRPFPSVLSGF